jgi:hypothetical protein
MHQLVMQSLAPVECRRTFRNAKCPPFWQQDGPAGLHRYSLRLLWTTAPLPHSAPAIVNAHEARAFAAWRQRKAAPSVPPLRLLSEAEHHRLRALAPGGGGGISTGAAPSGAALRAAHTGNVLQLAFGAEAPVWVGVDVPSGSAAPVAASGQVNREAKDTGATGSGYSTNGHITNGHATNGHATSGHATSGHTTNGHTTNGHTTNGHTTSGHTTNGHTTNGSCADVHSNSRFKHGHPSHPSICHGTTGGMPPAAMNGRAPNGVSPPCTEAHVDTSSHRYLATHVAFPAVMGNVWHWCEDLFSALPNNLGVHPLYEDFSSPCYDGQHNIILGGVPTLSQALIRPSPACAST